MKFRVVQRPASSARVDGGTRPAKYLTNHLGYGAAQGMTGNRDSGTLVFVKYSLCKLRPLVILRRPLACGNRDVSGKVTDDVISTSIGDDDFTGAEVFVREGREGAFN
ncbi:hypothetical protein SBP18_04710 [Rhodoferax ferrireducens]|nr:hypothetical protein [Rhodoferax ferrireducens]WPC67817.1 hypothetical protein SBP18_04710 [Rhodoferax ferrireducens]